MATKKREKAHLPIIDTLHVVNTFLREHGYNLITSEQLENDLSRNINHDIPIPIVKNYKEGTLWIDRFYVAWCDHNDNIKYLYLSKYHVWEERYSYKQARMERKDHSIKIDPEINAEFIKRKNGKIFTQVYPGIFVRNEYVNDNMRQAGRKAGMIL